MSTHFRHRGFLPMMMHLWKNRIREAAFWPSSILWARRLKAFIPCIKLELHKSLLRARGAQVSNTAVCSGIDLKGSKLVVGDYCSIGRIYVQAFDSVNVGKCVVINDGVTLVTGTHDPDATDYRFETAPIVIEDYAWIAMNSTVLPGVTVGEGAVIGAGSVVTRDVEPYEIVCGNPAKKIRGRKRQRYSYRPSYWFGPVSAWVGLQFDSSNLESQTEADPIRVAAKYPDHA